MDFSCIDAQSSEQLYLQIRRLIFTAIQEQKLRPGQRLPSIASLTTMANVSRMTVRHALDALVNEGWLYTVPGKGIFVAHKQLKITQGLQYLMGWSDEIRMQGLQPSAQLVSTEIVPADQTVSDALTLVPETAVYRITRVQFAENIPLAVDISYLIAEKFPGLDELITRRTTSLSQLLREEYGVVLVQGTQFMEAGRADKLTASLLNISPGEPVLISERTTYSDHNVPVEFIRAIHRSGLVRFKIALSANTQLEHSPLREVNRDHTAKRR